MFVAELAIILALLDFLAPSICGNADCQCVCVCTSSTLVAWIIHATRTHAMALAGPAGGPM